MAQLLALCTLPGIEQQPDLAPERPDSSKPHVGSQQSRGSATPKHPAASEATQAVPPHRMPEAPDQGVAPHTPVPSAPAAEAAQAAVPSWVQLRAKLSALVAPGASSDSPAQEHAASSAVTAQAPSWAVLRARLASFVPDALSPAEHAEQPADELNVQQDPNQSRGSTDRVNPADSYLQACLEPSSSAQALSVCALTCH